MHDVIVVGARCAGSAVAMLLARRGHRVLLIDKARFPSDRLSTHLLRPRAMAYLQHWGIRETLAKLGTPSSTRMAFTCEGITLVGMPSRTTLTRTLSVAHGRDFDSLEPEVEFACVRRLVLDRVLLEAAIDSGAEFREQCTVEDLLVDANGAVVGVRIRGDGRRFEQRAPLVIGADGRHSIVARLTGAKVLARSHDCSFAAYTYYSDLDVKDLLPPVHLRGRLGVGFAATNDELTLVSAWGPKAWHEAFRRDLEGNLNNTAALCHPTLGLAMRQAQREEPIRHTDDLANVLRQGTGLGWMLIGDAGCQVDQCTAIGITHAFRDAQLAADALERFHNGAQTMSDAMRQFDQDRLSELGPSFDFVVNAARCHATPPQQLTALAQMANQQSDIDDFHAMSSMIATVYRSKNRSAWSGHRASR